MDARTGKGLLWYSSVIGLGLLVGCSPIFESEIGRDPNYKPEVFAVQDEYVIWADGEWCPWSPGIKDCPHPYPAGIYRVNGKGEVLSDKKEGSLSVKYSPSQFRGCEQVLRSSQGSNVSTACSPNFLYSIQDISNDPLTFRLWGLTNKGVYVERAPNRAAVDIVVSVIDTGIDCSHPDLSCEKEYSALSGREGAGEARDDNGHGTHVAGTICAIGNNNVGITGVSSGCKLLAAKFLGANGGGSLYDGVKAIDWSIRNGANVINASWGGPGHSDVLQKAVQRASDAGVLFVVAAGNDGRNIDSAPQYPASYDYPGVITVASYQEDGKVSSFSNYGTKTVEVAAPGSNIFSTYPDAKYLPLSGTSMATPHVAGMVALLSQGFVDLGDSKAMALKKAETALYALSLNELKEITKYGKVRFGTPEQSLCQIEKCKNCVEKCNRLYECKCHKLTQCKKACRIKTKCKGSCK